MATVCVPRETRRGETRVAATPETVKKLVKRGHQVVVEAGAGHAAHFPDPAFAEAGAEVSGDRAALWPRADAVFTLGPLDASDEGVARELGALRRGAVVIGFLAPHRYPASVRLLAERGISALAMELVPRITRAQSMDALSSQASLAGYKAAVLAAERLDRYFPLLMTAAGTIPPARVVVIGAGVAGLQALATAKRLGAVVEVSDIRPAVEEQVASLGGRFIELPQMDEGGEGTGGYAREMGEDFLTRQREILKRHLAAADVVITTAQVPGKPAPRLVSTDMVEAMRPGSVIVDVAAEGGGNCELCRPDEEVEHRGVLILGPTGLAASAPRDASVLYARNLLELFGLLEGEEGLKVDLDDEVVAGTLLTHDGRVVHEATAAKLEEVEA